MAKKDKKKAKQQDDYWDTQFQEDSAAVKETSAPPAEPATGGIEYAQDPVMDELVDDFGGLMSAIKKSKGKKGKKQQPVEMVDANEEIEALDEGASGTANGAALSAQKEDEEEKEDAGEFRVKTKKEKEKEKKEREKAKKKAQADKKKAASGTPTAAPEPEAEPEQAAAEPAVDGEEDDEHEETTGAKSKKKKKKPAPKKEEPPPPAAAAKRKGPNISALQKRLAAQQAAEEARRIAEEEEKKRIEEEERKAAEEEARKEEEKRLKKEREKAKREDLRKKGLLLSKKQKEQQRLAALRHEQLLAAGNVTVAGLSGEPGEKPKRPVYGNRKRGKKDQEKTAAPAAKDSPAVEEEAPESSKVESPVSVVEPPKVEQPNEDETPESWDKEEEVADTWEEAAAESWEDNIDEDGNIKETPIKTRGTVANGKPEGDEEDHEEDEESEEETDSEEEEVQTAAQKVAAQKKAEAAHRREEQHKEALAARSKDNLRSPICCILGHVDTGKTKLLDKIRQTNVQEGEAGGITQQIGATYFPLDAIKVKTAPVNTDNSFDFKIPGLLIIDTPGHESFTNLRSRGSSLCNIAILVIDIMHGLEPQTLESIRLLRDRKTPFIVALNKIDRIYGWQATPNGAFRESLAKQTRAAQSEFQDRCDRAILALKEQGLNSCLYYDNKNFARNVSIVPTSAHTGEGIPDMLMLLVKLTQERMTEKLMYLSELECTVLEVKVIEGLGTTIDVILSNGVLHEGDRIVLCGLNGPIITNIRALLTPEPMKEMRVKSAYVHHKEVKAALGVKITAQDLSNAIAGSRLMVVEPDDDEDDLADEVMSDLQGLLNRIDKSGKGVCVQASTLGSLEALLEFLKTSKIPVSGINIGPVHKRDIMRCATMLERAPEYAVMLCFDVKVDREAEEIAAEMGVKIFSANIIYHLFDSFTAYQKELLELKRKEASGSAVFPCVLRIIQIFHSRDPIVLGVDVIEGSIRVGTPLAAVKVNETTRERTVYNLGKISSIEQNHKSVDMVKKGQSGAGVAIKIEGATQQLFGRHIDEKETLYSHITRHSIDTLKSPAMRDEVTKEEWALIVKLKTVFGI